MAGIVVKSPGTPPLTNVLTDTHIFVGDAANVPQDVALTLNPTGGAFALANTGALTMPNANATTRGLLTAADWTTFNNKQNAIADWTTAFNSGTQATSSWTATNAAANVNAAIIPKGTGALIAQIPDGTFVGGNARGINAVDFQRIRPSFAGGGRVATGERSFIGNGNGNFVSGTNSGVLCGDGNGVDGGNSGIVSGTNNSISGGDKRSFIGSGQFNAISSFPTSVGIVSGLSNTANNNYAFIGGGQSNTASGSHSVVGGGQSNTASGNQSAVLSGNTNTCSGSSQSVICGGLNNSNAGQQSAICGGRDNSIGGGGDKFAFIGAGYLNSTASGNKTAIVGGQENTATADYSVVVGGQSNASSGSRSFIGCGERNTASGTFSSVMGGDSATANLYGQQAYSAGRFSANGDAQAHELVWRRLVTGAPVGGTELFLDGASVAAILPGTNAIWQGIIDIAAVCTAAGNGTTVAGDVEATSYKVTIKRIGTNTVLVGSVQEIGLTNADASMASGTFTIDNNNANESLRIVYTSPVTAGSTTTIRVVATFRGLQIQY